MLTNGMSESVSSEICLKDVPPQAFRVMLDFMYSGEIHVESSPDSGTLILEQLYLADQFGITLLHQECCKMLLECLAEVIVITYLLVLIIVPSILMILLSCHFMQ